MFNYVQKQSCVTGLTVEKAWVEKNALDQYVAGAVGFSRQIANALLGSEARLTRRILKRSDALCDLSAHELKDLVHVVQHNLRTQGIRNNHLVEAFALGREISGRTLNMRHHSTQIQASLALLQGQIAEMATGEGKTLAASLAVITAGLSGVPVHVVTVNDYLAERDAKQMQPLYEAMGLSVGVISHNRSVTERREAYACDVCYCSNKELTFDYLKDTITLEQAKNTHLAQAQSLCRAAGKLHKLLLRGLHFAIVDEADSVFIDEARTPLIISGQENFGTTEQRILLDAMTVATELVCDVHFKVNDQSNIVLLEPGYKCLIAQAEQLGGIWQSRFYSEPLIKQALTALHVYQRDKDYIVDVSLVDAEVNNLSVTDAVPTPSVSTSAVQIVDSYTGRIMPGRSWGQGLQQMIEIKEGLPMSKPRETKAEISYQNFFRKFHHLSGMTGTVQEVSKELQRTYRVRTTKIPLLKKSLRKKKYREVFLKETSKWQRVVEITQESIALGQAVLIGTYSVASSEAVSQVLHLASIKHTVLNARQDKQEAGIIAKAGNPGSVTVATSMAGRGTDIKLDAAVKASGGLHVIITELHDASRIDRQLAGRCARQGDPGRISHILALDDRLIKKTSGPIFKKILEVLNASNVTPPHAVGWRIQRMCQKRLENQYCKLRKQLIKNDKNRQITLAFIGDNK